MEEEKNYNKEAEEAYNKTYIEYRKSQRRTDTFFMVITSIMVLNFIILMWYLALAM